MILQEAILHIPLSQYAFANSEMNLTIRIRVAKDNLTDCVLWYGDRVQPGDPIVFTAVYMKKILSDMHLTIMMQLLRLRMTGYATILN